MVRREAGLQGSDSRVPDILVLADGVAVPGVMAARVVSSATSSADRAQVTLAYHAGSASYWSGWAPSRLEVRIGIEGDWNSLFLGVVDLVAFDLTEGLVEIEARDLTALLIDCVVEQSFPNLTASDIVQQLAGQVGLVPVVTLTTGLVGRYWRSDFAKLALGNYGRARSAWDILVFLAAEEVFDVYVSSDQLYFTPASSSASAGGVAVQNIVDASQCISLRLERSLRLAGNIEVGVRSWNSRTKQGCVATSLVAGNDGEIWKKMFVRPNLMIEDAQAIATHEAWELASHERVVCFSRPGEFLLGVRDLIVLSGSGLDFDQNYIVDEIEWVIGAERGFLEHVRARAMSAGRTVSVSGNM